MTSDTSHAPAHRYAVYFAPDMDGPAWQAGSRWLGRCAALQQSMPQIDIPGIASATLARLTAEPRRYGWHATLKAPFALAPGVSWPTLRHAVHTLAQQLRPFAMPPLQVARMGDFLALTPMATHPGHADIQAVAAACVTQLQALAAPLSATALARRRAAGLSPRQDALLQQWGYPFVLEEFRFHLSLTGSLSGADPHTVALLEDAAQQRFADLPPLRFNSLALFAEPTPGADFVLLEQLEMGT